MATFKQLFSRLQLGHVRALLAIETDDWGIASGTSHRFVDAVERWSLTWREGEKLQLSNVGIEFLQELRADATWSIRIDSMLAARAAEKEATP